MMKSRNSYLINRSLKKFLVASIATMAVMNINGVVGSVLMGQLIGPQAVSAIQNVVPVLGLVSAISLLFSAGAAITTAKALGRRNFDEAGSSMTVSVSSCLGFGLIISFLSGVLAPKISSLLCQDRTLYDKSMNGNEETLRVEGWLDTQAAPDLLAELEQMDDHVNSLILDFSGLEYMSSAGLRALVVAYEKVKGALVIKNASSRIRSIFRTTGLDRTIRIE